MTNEAAKFKVGDLVVLSDVPTVPHHLRGKLAIIYRIIPDGLKDLAFIYDPTKPGYLLYVNSEVNRIFWEEGEFELADTEHVV